MRPYKPPTRNRLIFRGVVIAVGLLMASGVWDHYWMAFLAWVFVLMGLGERSAGQRIAGMILAMALTRNFPTKVIYWLASREEIETNLRATRVMILGAVAGAVITWIAGAVRPMLRRVGDAVPPDSLLD